MKNKKWIALIFFGLLLITTFQIINPVSAEENPSGYIIIGNKVIWNTSNGYLEVYPHTSNNAITQIQYCNFTWKKSDTNIDMAFIFNNKLLGNKDVFIWKNISHIVKVPIYQNVTSYYELYSISNFKQLNITPQYVDYGDIPSLKYYTGKINFQNSSYKNLTVGFDSMRWLNTQHTNANFTYHYLKLTGYSNIENFYFDWCSIKDKFNYTIYSGKHYYYYKDIPIIHNKTYNLKWIYDIPMNNKGKWELLLKLSSDTLLESYSTGRYVLIDPWYNTAWSYSKKITIDHTKVMSSLINFPILIDNTSSSFSHAQATGYDFVFIKSDNITKYNHEIESFTANRLIVWVNITLLSSNVDTVIFLYYGNSLCSNQQNKYGTWDSNYKAVYHQVYLANKLVDSTIYKQNSSSLTNSVNSYSGKIDGAIDYPNSGYYTIPSVLGISVNYMTIESWFNPDTITSDDGVYGNTPNPSPYPALGVYNSKWWFAIKMSTIPITNPREENRTLTVGLWQYAVVTFGYSNLTLQFFYQGKLFKVITTGNGAVYFDGTGIYIGKYSSSGVYDGKSDELRFSDIRRNGSWINTSFLNQNSPSTFLIIGNEVMISIYPPSSFFVHSLNQTKIFINWTKNGNSKIIIVKKINSYPILFIDSIIYNGTGNNYTETGLIYNTHYFYRAYGYNYTLNTYSSVNISSYDTTIGYNFSDPNSTGLWLYLGAMLTLDNGQFFLLILIGLWSYFIYLYYKEKEVIFSFCIICCGLPLGIILSGVAYYNSYPFGYLISFILILISFLIPTYGIYQKNKNKK